MIQTLSTVTVYRREKTISQKIRDSILEEEGLKLELKECARFRWKKSRWGIIGYWDIPSKGGELSSRWGLAGRPV